MMTAAFSATFISLLCPSEIILRGWCDAQDSFIIIIMLPNMLFSGFFNEYKVQKNIYLK